VNIFNKLCIVEPLIFKALTPVGAARTHSAYIYIAGSRLGPVQNGSSQERSRDGIYFMGSGMVPVMKEK